MGVCRTSSSISSSDPKWRSFAAWLGSTVLAGLAILYGFVVLVDPWDVLALSPPAPRVPISTNARFSFPALARSPRFDSIILGTSTARLLQPAQLDGAFGARFANLAMNSATAYEQSRLLTVFLRAHPAPRVVVIDLDASWCGPASERYTSRPFPEWMYKPITWPSIWRAYREMLTPYAVQEAANQFAVLMGWKRRRYGLDGYTSFVPDDAAYDRDRVAAAFARWPPLNEAPAGPAVPLPAMALLQDAVLAVPPGTRVILFFPPNHVSQHGRPGSAAAAGWAACKQAASAIAGATVLDFMIPSAITRDRENYWDPLHYRRAIGAEVAAALAQGGGPNTDRLR